MQSIFFAASVAVIILITFYPAASDDTCIYGNFTTNTGRVVCFKGPDRECGNIRKGLCGPGLICNNCNLCAGCSSVNMNCSTIVCVKLRPYTHSK